ncbi:MAG: hypothetical protein KJ587_17105 [Alphaproteobacteria bacterium]|nr:hypothetical protein [Alphaproteobacteria bacterium]
MKIPKEINDVCRNFHQDIHLHTKTLDDMVEFATNGIGDTERKIVAAYLDEILSDRFSDDDLKDIWYKTPADVYFPEGGHLRQLLEKMREALSKQG